MNSNYPKDIQINLIEEINMTKIDLEKKVKDLGAELIGLKEIYEGGISKKELRMFALKWTVVGLVAGAVIGHLVL